MLGIVPIYFCYHIQMYIFLYKYALKCYKFFKTSSKQQQKFKNLIFIQIIHKNHKFHIFVYKFNIQTFIRIQSYLMNFDKEQLINLVVGTLGLFTIYCASGIIHQYLIVLPYTNFKTGLQSVLDDKAILVFFPTLVTWIIGNIYNRCQSTRTAIPQKNTFICGFLVFVSTITYTWAVSKTSFPIVMAFKSCNLLSVLLVAILCTRVKQKNLNLGAKKIVIGLIISAGIFLFSYFDPQKKQRTQSSQIIGIVLLIISLLADGFLPDFQAQIKSQYKPQPTQMMQHINKWVAIISLISMFLSNTAFSAFQYAFYHPMFSIHLIGMSILSCVGQFFVYRMIKQFKQHIVPFVITTRKILTIFLSIIYYNHKTSPIQMVGVILVFLTVIYQFSSQLKKDEVKQEKFEKVIDFSQEIDTERGGFQVDEDKSQNKL